MKFSTTSNGGVYYEDEIEEDYKEYEHISVLVKREYDDGDIHATENKTLLSILAEDEPGNILTKRVRLIRRPKAGSGESYSTEFAATDYYLVLKNPNYKKGISEFSTAASNSYVDAKVRFKFVLDDAEFIFIKDIRMGQGYTLLDIVSNLEEYLDELAESENKALLSCEESNDYTIFVLNSVHYPTDFDIEKSELLDSLVSVEFIQANHVIIEGY